MYKMFCWNIHTKFKINVSWIVNYFNETWNTEKNAQLVKSRKLYFFQRQNTVNIVLRNNISCFIYHSHQQQQKKNGCIYCSKKFLSKCLSKKCAYMNKINEITLTHHQSHSHLIKYVFVVFWCCNDTQCCLLLFLKKQKNIERMTTTIVFNIQN